MPAINRISRNVVLVGYHGLAMFEFGVVCDVFGADWSADLAVPWYDFAFCAATDVIAVEGGYQLQVRRDLSAVRCADSATRCTRPGRSHRVVVHRRFCAGGGWPA